MLSQVSLRLTSQLMAGGSMTNVKNRFDNVQMLRLIWAFSICIHAKSPFLLFSFCVLSL